MVSISSDWVKRRWRYAMGDKFHHVPLDPGAPIGDGETWAEGYPIVFLPGEAGGAARFVKFEDKYDSWSTFALNCDGTRFAVTFRKDRGRNPEAESVLHVFDLVSGERKVLKGHHGNVSGALFSPKESRVLFTASSPPRFGEDGEHEILIWDLSAPMEGPTTVPGEHLLRSAEAAVGGMSSLGLSTEEQAVLRSKIQEALTKVMGDRVISGIPKLHGRLKSSTTSEAISHDGRYMIYEPGNRPHSNGRDERWVVRVYDLQAKADRVELKGHTDTILCVAWSHTDKWIMTVAWDGTIRIWDPTEGEEVWRWTTKKQNWRGAFGPPGRDGEAEWAIASSGDGIVHCWSLFTGEEMWQHPGNRWPRALAVSPSGRYIAVGRQDAASVELLDLHRDRGEKPHHVETATRRSLARGDLRVPLSSEAEEETDPKKKEEIQFMAEHMTVSMHEVRDVRFIHEP